MAQNPEELHSDTPQEIDLEKVHAQPLHQVEVSDTHDMNETQVEKPEIPQEINVESVKSPEQPGDSPMETSQIEPKSIEKDPDSQRGAPFDEEKGIKKYAWIGILVLIFIVVFGLIFMLISHSAKPNKIKLVYWGLWEDSSVYAPLIADYQKKHPNIVIDYQKQSLKDYKDKILVRVKEGSGPDIFRYHNTWVPMLTDVLSDIPSKIMSVSEFKSTFYPVASNDLIVKAGTTEKIVGVPLEIDGLVLLYNVNSLKRVGFSDPPKTWDDVLKYSQELTVPDQTGSGVVTSGIALGTAENIEHFSDILGWMLLQNGTSISQLDSPEAAKALELYREFAEKPLALWNDSMPSSINAFAQGKVAMIIVPSWQIHSIKALNPDLDFRASQLPILPGETTPLSLSSYWVEGVSHSSKYQKEAWDFLTYLSQKEQMLKLFAEESKTRSFGEPYSRVDLAGQLTDHPYLGAIVSQGPYFKTQPTVAFTSDNGLNDEIIVYLKNAVNQASTGVSYTEAFKTAAKGVSQVFTKYKISK
ncbi:MAG: ABC transporter substrate-binding protein [Candidatus Roizmanbacteria bacterium]